MKREGGNWEQIEFPMTKAVSLQFTQRKGSDSGSIAITCLDKLKLQVG